MKYSLTMKDLKRVLWISDYFPRPHDLTTGVWALETIFAIKKQGIDVIVLSPTPWIPRWLAFTPTLRDWTSFHYECKIRNLSIFYPKCLYYPHRFTRYLYGFLPPFDRLTIFNWCRETISRLVDRYPFQVRKPFANQFHQVKMKYHCFKNRSDQPNYKYLGEQRKINSWLREFHFENQ